jgi:hypothetical protein
MVGLPGDDDPPDDCRPGLITPRQVVRLARLGRRNALLAHCEPARVASGVDATVTPIPGAKYHAEAADKHLVHDCALFEGWGGE